MGAYEALAENMANVSCNVANCFVCQREQEINWYDEYKDIEQGYMVLMDRYSELAKALGFFGKGYWGDVMEPHSEIVERAKMLREANEPKS